MKQLTINGMYEISIGILKGVYGKVVGYDSRKNEVWIQIDELTSIVTTSENVEEYNGEPVMDLFM